MEQNSSWGKEQIASYKKLKKYRGKLKRSQVKTLAGQIKSGNPQAALKGLENILNKAGGKDGKAAQKNKSKPV